MEIEYLREFTVVAKLGSFSRAAEELCLSQSALSKHILALERELGTNLLVRNSRNVSLSTAGAQILPLANQIYVLSNKLRVVADRQSYREKRPLRLFSIPVMAQYNITGLLAKFQQCHPNIGLEVTECEQKQLLSLLNQGECELGFCRMGMKEDGDLEVLELCRDELVAVLPQGHPLAQQNGILLTELKEEPLLFLSEQTGFHHLYASLCRGAGFVPNIAYTGNRPENIVDLVAQNMGVGLLMRRHTEFVANPGVTWVGLSPRVESRICLVRPKTGVLTAEGQMFWEFVQGSHSTTE